MTKLLKQLCLLVWVFPALAQNLQISGGNNFSAAVCDNQVVYVWGSNATTVLGIDATDAPVGVAYRNIPGAVTRGNINNTATGVTYGDLPAIRQIDAGSGGHITGLSCARQVWGWGLNDNGQLGRNNTGNSPIPQRALRGQQASLVHATNDPNGIFLHDIVYVSGGNNTTFAIEAVTGRVLAWGQNDHGQLGDGTNTTRLTPVYVLSGVGTQLTNIVQIEGGDDCTYALDANGNVWSWGLNGGNQLGRTNGGTTVTGPLGTGDPYASRVIQGDPLNNGYSATPTPVVYLSGITQISGGDTHCLALDANGNVWSFGGDWGEGQLGRAGGSVYQNDARRVARPGLATYATANADFLGNGIDGKAVYVAAGQSMSAVVMANGKVVTFGSRGLFNGGATDQASGTVITCPGTGDMIASGSLGDGSALGCNSGSCNNKATQFSRVPVYVQTGGVHLTGIKQISDGDAWFYAIDGTGNAYTWGWNRRGELGLGDYSDRCSAVAFSFPSGCALSTPCPGQPVLPPDYQTCPVVNTLLDSQQPQLYPTFKYTWYYRASPTDPWLVYEALGDSVKKRIFQLGQYKVEVSDTRTSVPFLCAPCPVLKDSVLVTELPSPYTGDGEYCTTTNTGTFSVTSGTTRVKWYTNPTGGTPLNPTNEDPTIVLNDLALANSSIPGCDYALFAEDVSSYPGTLRPAATKAAAPCAGVGASDHTGQRVPLQIEASNNLDLTSVDFIYPSFGYNTNKNYTVRIYANNPTGGGHCGSCTPPGTKDGKGALLYTSPVMNVTRTSGNPTELITIPVAYTLTGTSGAPVKYWIEVNGEEVIWFNCSDPAFTAGTINWATPEVDNSGYNVLRATSAMEDTDYEKRGAVLNIKFQVGPEYTCDRYLVCVNTENCPAPVEYLYFNAEKSGDAVVLNWATSMERDADHFVIHRSGDGINWAPWRTVDAAGNSSTATIYSTTDENPIQGVSYYKLIQVDNDGTSHPGPVSTIEFVSELAVHILPNPSKDGLFQLSVNAPDNSSVKVFTTVGQSVYEKTVSRNFNGTLDLSALPKGVYHVTVLSGNKAKSVSLIIE